MKKSILLTVITLLLGVVGCERDEQDSIIGTWSLVKVRQGFSEDKSFEMYEMLCVFGSEMKVEVKTTLATSLFLPIGIYNYSFISKKTISINNKEYEYIISKDQLVLMNNAASDGDIFEFQRITN